MTKKFHCCPVPAAIPFCNFSSKYKEPLSFECEVAGCRCQGFSLSSLLSGWSHWGLGFTTEFAILFSTSSPSPVTPTASKAGPNSPENYQHVRLLKASNFMYRPTWPHFLWLNVQFRIKILRMWGDRTQASSFKGRCPIHQTNSFSYRRYLI